MCSLIQKWPTVTVSHQCLGLLSHGDTLKPCQRKMLMKHLTLSFFVASIMSNSQGLEVRAPCKVCYKQSSLILSLSIALSCFYTSLIHSSSLTPSPFQMFSLSFLSISFHLFVLHCQCILFDFVALSVSVSLSLALRESSLLLWILAIRGVC